MEKPFRITVKDLKKWLNTVDENAEVYVDKYTNVHAKEFINVREYDEQGKYSDKELLVSSIEVIS